MDDTIKQTASPDEIWLSISDLAREKNVDKAEISRRVAKLEADGRLQTRSGPNRTKLVCLQEYDRVAGEFTDLAKEQAAETSRYGREADWGGDTRFRDAQTRRAQYEAGLKSIELRERLGQVVDITRAQEIIAEVGEEIRQPLEQLPLRADEINAAAVSGGVVAVRSKLKDIVFDLRTAIADALRKLDLRAKGGAAPP